MRHFRDRAPRRQHLVQVGQRVLRQPADVDGQGLGLQVREEDRRRPGHEHQNVGAPCHRAAGFFWRPNFCPKN